MVRDIGGPGWRKPVAALRHWQYKDYGKVLCQGMGLCGVAAIIHAINCTLEKFRSLFYLEKLKELRPVFGTLSGMIETLRQMKGFVPPHMNARV